MVKRKANTQNKILVDDVGARTYSKILVYLKEPVSRGISTQSLEGFLYRFSLHRGNYFASEGI